MNISNDQKSFLETVAKLAYGSGLGEGAKGGKGNMALVNVNGTMRVIKCNTHLNHAEKVQKEISKGGALKIREGLINGSNLLREKLMEIGRSLGLTEARMNELLGPGGEGKDAVLLTRRNVARFVSEVTAANKNQGSEKLADIWNAAKSGAVKSKLSMTFDKVTALNSTDFNGGVNRGDLAKKIERIKNGNLSGGFLDGAILGTGDDNPVVALIRRFESGKLLTEVDERVLERLEMIERNWDEKNEPYKNDEFYEVSSTLDYSAESIKTVLTVEYGLKGLKEPSEEDTEAFLKSDKLRDQVMLILTGKYYGNAEDMLQSIHGLAKEMAESKRKAMGAADKLEANKLVVNELKVDEAVEDGQKVREKRSSEPEQKIEDVGGRENVDHKPLDLNEYELAVLDSFKGLTSSEKEYLGAHLNDLNIKNENDVSNFSFGGKDGYKVLNLLKQRDQEFMSKVEGYDVIGKLTRGSKDPSMVISNRRGHPAPTVVSGGKSCKRTNVIMGKWYEDPNPVNGRDRYSGYKDQSCLFHSILVGLGVDVTRDNGLVLRKALDNYVNDCMKQIQNMDDFVNVPTLYSFLKATGADKEFNEDQMVGYIGVEMPKDNLVNGKVCNITNPTSSMDEFFIPFLASMLGRPISLSVVNGTNEQLENTQKVSEYENHLYNFNVMTGKKIESAEPLRIMICHGHYQALEKTK